MERAMPRMSKMLAAISVSLVCAAAGCQDAPYDRTTDLVYDSTIGAAGTFDVYEPQVDSSRTLRPAIIAIHGGAWMGGDKDWGENIAEEFCPAGYVVVSINYRLSSNPNGTWPVQITDVQNALKFIRANAQRFRIDPARVASLGMSAGGHLATMVALRDDSSSVDGRVSVAVNLDGEHDMTMPPDQVMSDFDNILTKVMGHGGPWSGAELRDISTVTFARPDVSLLTVHGTGDDNVYVAQGERISKALQSVGADVEFIRIDGADGKCHEDCWRVPVARKALHRFLSRKLAHDETMFLENRQHGKPSGNN